MIPNNRNTNNNAPLPQQQQQQQVQQMPNVPPLLRISQKLSQNDSLTRYFPKNNTNQQQQQNQNQQQQQPPQVVIDDTLSARFPNHSAVAVRDARFTSTYYYAVIFNVTHDLTPPFARKKQISACLRSLKYQSNSRMVIAWHESPQAQNNNNNNNHQNNSSSSSEPITSTTVPEEIFSMLNEECVYEQVPLVWASSSRECVGLILSLSKPTGVRTQRITTFGKSAQSVNAKMASLLLHSMSTQMMSEGEAVRAVDAFSIQFPGATPADLILFLGGVASERVQKVLQKAVITKTDQIIFLTKSVLLNKPRAERVLSVFQSDFFPGEKSTLVYKADANNTNSKKKQDKEEVLVVVDDENDQAKRDVPPTTTIMMNNNNSNQHQQQQLPPPRQLEQKLFSDDAANAIREFVQKNTTLSTEDAVVSTQMRQALKNTNKNGNDDGDDDGYGDGAAMLNFQ